MKDFNFSFDAIGTKWNIKCMEVSGKTSKFELLLKIKERIEVFDKTYSRFRKDSLVWKISKMAGEYEFPPDSKDLFALYNKLYKITDGAFTLLIGNTLDQAGYGADYSLVSRKIHKVPNISQIYSFNYPKLTVKKPYILDFGGLGKGYLVDIISELLLENGVVSFVVDAGGDIFCFGLKKPLRVGLENPNDFKQVIGVAEIINRSICASAGSRRKWKNFHHIINPHSLSSPTDILATWVVAKNTLIADGIATCLFFVSKEKLQKYFDFECLILHPDFLVERSKNFPGQVFTKN